MPTLETPNSGTCANLPTTAPGGDASTREKAKDAQTYDVEDSKSEPEPDKEAPDGAARAESPMIAHLQDLVGRYIAMNQPRLVQDFTEKFFLEIIFTKVIFCKNVHADFYGYLDVNFVVSVFDPKS